MNSSKDGGKLFDKLKKGFLITAIVIIVVFALCILQYAIHYYSNPLKKEVSFSTSGYLIFDPDGNEYEPVMAEVQGENLHYLFHNRPDAIQGDIWINGHSLFGHGKDKGYVETRFRGFYSEFHESDYTAVSIGDENKLCKIISLSKTWDTIVCGIILDTDITGSIKPGERRQALLIIPADSPESSLEKIRYVSDYSEQMNEWLNENGWIQ